jgi:hypothetical protein
MVIKNRKYLQKLLKCQAGMLGCRELVVYLRQRGGRGEAQVLKVRLQNCLMEVENVFARLNICN